jgi:anti-sigma factor RsiW
MSNPNPTVTAAADHHMEWNDRLQDWLDGDIEAGDDDVFARHLLECALCQLRVAQMQELESTLMAAAPRLQLDESFDAKLFAQIDAIDESDRAAARQRAEEDLRRNLQALSHNWRRTLTFVIPGIVAGIALAVGLTGYLDSAGVTAALAAEGASKLGGSTSTLHLMITSLLGAGIGATMAGWLARLAE